MIALFTAAAASAVSDDAALLVDNGDDAAVFASNAPTVVSTDMLVEGTHFRRDWSNPAEIGARAIAQAASDIAAMGALPRYIVVALCLPANLPLDDVAQLGQGAAAAASRAGARIVGGDITTGAQLIVSPTAMGTPPASGRILTLGGAQPGDVLALTGFPGRAAAGYELHNAGMHDGLAQQLFRVPEPPYAAGPAAAAAGAHALTDVTDGLLRDTHAMMRASATVANLHYATFRNDPVLSAAAAHLGSSQPATALRKWRLTGGEDHGLLGAFAPGQTLPEGFRAVGVIQKADALNPAGTVLVDGGKAEITGWDSARGSAEP